MLEPANTAAAAATMVETLLNCEWPAKYAPGNTAELYMDLSKDD